MAEETDWAGTHRYRAPVLPVCTVEDVTRAVRAYPRVRALGTRHTFNGLADSPGGVLLDLTGLPADICIDRSAAVVTVGAGTPFAELAPVLDRAGLALHNLGSLPHISVGGAVATGTHGSGDRLGCLATAVRAMQVVGADGVPREHRRGDRDFAGLVVALGAAGVVTRLTLDVQPTYEVRQDVYRGLPWEAVADWPAVSGCGDSVSVFTTWTGDHLGDAWVKRRITAGESRAVPDSLVGATRDQRTRDFIVAGITGNVTEQGGRPGTWWTRLPHFRADVVPSNGNEMQSEWFCDRAQATEVLNAVRAIGAQLRPFLIVSELRTVAADDLWLSGAYQRDTLAVHFTWRHVPEVRAVCVPLLEATLAPFAARPHWGKVHGQQRSRLAQVHPRLADACDLLDTMDPGSAFSSPALQDLGVRSPSASPLGSGVAT